MARTQQVKEKGNAHTTEYEKNTPVETQGFYVYFFCLRNSAYEMRRDTSSRLRFLSVTYPQVRFHQESHALLVWLAFLGGGAGAILRPTRVFQYYRKKIDFLLDSFYTIYRLAFDYERYTNERNKGILPFDLEK